MLETTRHFPSGAEPLTISRHMRVCSSYLASCGTFISSVAPLCPLWFRGLLKTLHHHSDPLPAANTRRGQPILLLAPLQFVEQRDHQPRSGCAQRMAQRDCAAVYVH